MEARTRAGIDDSKDLPIEIERLRSEHRELEERLEELNRHVYLTPGEQLEAHEIKKQKLRKKDRIRELETELPG